LPPIDARHALLSQLFDHAPMFPPAGMELAEALAEGREEVWPRFEAVLVQVVARPLARAQHEVALEIRRGDERVAKLRVVHASRATART